MAVSIIGPKFYAWDSDTGAPLAFGKVFTYQAGTNTPKATFQSEDGVTANANPTILNGAGYANIYLDGSYKVVVKDADDVEVWTSDPVTDPSGLQKEWINERAATQVSPTSFSIVGNHTDVYTAGKALQLDDASYLYGYVDSVTYVGGNTVVEVLSDDPLTGSLTRSWTGIASMNSLPQALSGSSESLQDAVSKRVIRVTSVSDLLALATPTQGSQVSTFSYHSGFLEGGGVYYWDSTKSKADHNGGTVLDPGKSFPDWAVDAEVEQWFTADGAGDGCWIRSVYTNAAFAFGAFSSGTNDNSRQIQSCVDSLGRCVIEVSTTVKRMIELNSGTALYLTATGRLIKPSGLGTDPVVWIKGLVSNVIGEGQRSAIVSLSDCPFGIIRMGMKDMFDTGSTVSYSGVRNCAVQGPTAYGNASGDTNKGIYMAAAQISSSAVVYFNHVRDVWFKDLNTALSLNGWANANQFSGIQLYRCGNGSHPSDGRFAMHWNGAQECTLSEVFHHFSPDAFTLVVENLTGEGGVPARNYFPQYNNFDLISEQGGYNARCLVVRGGARNRYFVHRNVNRANELPSNFFETNSIYSAGDASLSKLNTVASSVSGRTELAGTTLIQSAKVVGTEAVEKDLLTVSLIFDDAAFVKISGTAKATALDETSVFSYEWAVQRVGAIYTITQISGTTVGTAGSIGFTDGTEAKFHFTPTNNGTGTDVDINYNVLTTLANTDDAEIPV